MSDRRTLAPGCLLNEREVGAILSIPVQTLRNWRWKGIGPKYLKVGGRTVRYHKDDLEAFVAEHTEHTSGGLTAI